MVLSSDKKTVDPYDQFETVKEVQLGPLETGKGVRIGDSMAQVRMLLGPPTKIVRIQDWNVGAMQYVHETGMDEYGMSDRYEAVYVFAKGKLVTIKIYQDVMGGP